MELESFHSVIADHYVHYCHHQATCIYALCLKKCQPLYMLPASTDRWHRPPRSDEMQPMSKQSAATTSLYCGLLFGNMLLHHATDAVINRV